MTTEVRNQIFQIIQILFTESTVQEADKQYFGLFKQLVSQLTTEEKEALIDTLLSTPLPQDNPLALYLCLFDVFQEPRFVERLPAYMGSNMPLNMFAELFWNMISRSFTGQTLPESMYAKLREHHQIVSTQANNYLTQMGVRKKKRVSKVRNVAIISPQILGMRHAPSREAFSLALHLEHNFGCNAFIFNTNGFAYTNQMGLLDPHISNIVEALKDAQVVKVDYMQFKQQDVRLINFDGGAMSTRKLANILDTLAQLDIDAVIAHGENSLIQESIYGMLPSIFATTGDVVPFAHSDAYFVPKHLFNETHQRLAEEYKHTDDFLLESMLVTPEGKETGVVNKQDYGIANESFVYLVVGMRLHLEMCDEFIALCERLIAHSSDIVIAFAGTRLLQLNTFFSEELIASSRVVQLGFQDLPKVSSMADVYLNPLRNGGGTSSQTAILNGLPIVTRDYGHISAVVPEGLRHSTWESYFTFAIALKNDSALYENWQTQLETYFLEHLNTEQQVAKIYHKLVEVSEQRYSA